MKGLFTKDEADLDRERYDKDAADVKAQLADEPEPVVAPLPAYDHDGVCSKCHFIAGTTQYRRGYHGNECPIPETPFRLDMDFGGMGRAWPSRERLLNGARWQRRADAIPEHFDRECPNCKHKWAEAVG